MVARPADAEQAAAALRVCAELRAAVVPWGGGTCVEVGNPPRAADVVLLTERLSRVIDYDDANLTVTVEAGATLGALSAVLAERGQWLPLEPPRAEAATVGGAAATNLSGPRRMAFGAARDLAIGVRAALTDGSVIKWGGKTVKNVAGYDMAKLFVGSLGTLGLLTELTLKVYPLPETTRTITAWRKDLGNGLGPASDLVNTILASPLLPTAVTIVNPVALGLRAGVLVRVEGIEAAVDRHERDIMSWASQAGFEAEVLTGDHERDSWRDMRDIGWRDGEAAVRLSVIAGRVPAVLAEIEAALPASAAIVAHVPAGMVWIAATPDELAPALPALRDLTQRHSGHLLLARAPRELKAGGDVWFPAPQALSLMRGLKRAFDPHDILNPGRYVARL
jgi:glycolate oxidase FAD binding subunit